MKLTDKFPGYFDLRVFRVFAAISWIYLIYLFFTTPLVIIDYECTNPTGCINPFYICSGNETPLLSTCNRYEDLSRQIIKSDFPIYTKVFEYGFEFHNSDLNIYKVGTILILLFMAPFIVNGYLYYRKTGSWRYKQ